MHQERPSNVSLPVCGKKYTAATYKSWSLQELAVNSGYYLVTLPYLQNLHQAQFSYAKQMVKKYSISKVGF